jgi:NTP pyrophosphatase (non-canonical NTP hydrolase)
MASSHSSKAYVNRGSASTTQLPRSESTFAPAAMDFQKLTEQITAFRNERDWEQFHTPKNLAAALSIEAAELQELMLWKNDSEVAELAESKPGHGNLSDEIADVLIYTLLFCESAGIDPEAAVRIKLQKNAEKYPIEKAKGSSAKYTEF